jgi:hypothetical protein
VLIFGEFSKEILDNTKEFLLYRDVVDAFGGFCFFPVHKEIAVVRKETGCQDAGENDVEMMSSSLPLTAEELADLEKQTYGKAGGDEDVKIVSAEKKIC